MGRNRPVGHDVERCPVAERSVAPRVEQIRAAFAREVAADEQRAYPRRCLAPAARVPLGDPFGVECVAHRIRNDVHFRRAVGIEIDEVALRPLGRRDDRARRTKHDPVVHDVRLVAPAPGGRRGLEAREPRRAVDRHDGRRSRHPRHVRVRGALRVKVQHQPAEIQFLTPSPQIEIGEGTICRYRAAAEQPPHHAIADRELVRKVDVRRFDAHQHAEIDHHVGHCLVAEDAAVDERHARSGGHRGLRPITSRLSDNARGHRRAIASGQCAAASGSRP